MMESVSQFTEQFPYIGLFLLLVLGGIGLPFPEDATLMLCGFLIAQKVIHPLRALVSVYAGLLIADTIIYHLGKKYGRRIVTHHRFHRFLSPLQLTKIEAQFNRRGVFFILFGRHLIGLRAQIFLVAGIMKMRLVKFILADAVSALVTISIMVGIGYTGGNSLEALRKDMNRIKDWAIVILLAGVMIYLLYKYVKSRWEETGNP
jgi:membrane protein DedA with SNARE-associated domain